MRLDEWQKYIDTQFLEEEPEPVPTPQTAKPSSQAAKAVTEAVKPEPPAKDTPEAETITQAALFTAVFAEEPVSAAPAPPETAPLAVQNTVTIVVASPPPPVLPPAGRPPRIELLTPLAEPTPEPTPGPPRTEEVANRTRRRSQSVESAPISDSDTPADTSAPFSSRDTQTPTLGLFAPISDLDTDIPVFQQYLPSSHAAAAPSEVPALNRLQAPIPFPPDLPQTQEANKQENSTTENIVTQAKPTEDIKTTADIKQEDNAQADSTGKKSDSPAEPYLERVRRAPKSRARHARNVRPENVPSGLSATELWAAVPRHVQTLLALERLEEKEVAQFSYKRQFQEKRHELIERLLDPILSLEDTARLLNVCPTTVRRYTNKGILTYYRKEPERSLRAAGETNGGATNSGDTNVSVTNVSVTNGGAANGGAAVAVNEKETRQRRFRLSDILSFLETQQAAIESDRQAEQQAERRRLTRAANAIAALPLASDAAPDTLHAGKDS